MAFDPDHYIPLTPLWEVFTDKDTLSFLRGGYALFFEDNDRAQYKEVFMLVDTGGAYPNYAYQPYGFLNGSGQWQVDLNAQGAFDQVVYGYPFDANGDPQLYFIQFYNQDGVFQFSREAWPNLSVSGANTETVTQNLIPNPQFITHTNIPNPGTPGAVDGELTQAVTNVAYGGWTFERSNTSSIDIITWTRYGSFLTPPPDGNPRYGINVECTSPGVGQTFKYLAVKFSDVNKFATTNASTDPTTPGAFTFAFLAVNNGVGTVPVTFELIRNFGTGGSPTVITPLATFNITTTYPSTYYLQSFDFPSNAGKTIGQNDDDFVQLGIQFPLNASYNLTLTNFIFAEGIFTNPRFPELPDSFYLYQSLFLSGQPGYPNSTPDYNSLDLGLPLILGQNGITYDESVIGDIEITMIENAGFGRLVCDGQTSYDTTLYSSDGIPYARLGSKLFNSTLNCPLFGTGPQFVTLAINSDSQTMRLVENSPGVVTLPADGTNPTGFTFNTCHLGSAPFGFNANFVSPNEIYIFNLAEEFGSISAGTSGFTVSDISQSADVRTQYSVVVGAVPAAGTYFTFTASATTYYVWYKVNGAGVDPAPGGTGILVNIYTAGIVMNANDVAAATCEAINGYQNSFIKTVAASTIPAGAYFTFSSTIKDYYVWYQVSGSGTDPQPANRLGIMVAILTTDTAAQVATKTQIAINSRYFATPDLRGWTMRFWSNGVNNIDLDQALRFSTNSIITGNVIGTYEWYRVQSHQHPTGGDTNDFQAGAIHADWCVPQGFASAYTGYTAFYGGTETRSSNIYVNGFIRY